MSLSSQLYLEQPNDEKENLSSAIVGEGMGRKRKQIETDENDDSQGTYYSVDEEDSDENIPPVLTLPSRIVKDPKRRLQTMPILLPENTRTNNPSGQGDDETPRVNRYNMDSTRKRKDRSLKHLLQLRMKKKSRHFALGRSPRTGQSTIRHASFPMPNDNANANSSSMDLKEQLASEGARRVVVGIRTEKEFSHSQVRHARDFMRPGFACVCGAKFTGAGGLYVHQVKNMENEKFGCTLCGKRFHYFSGLKAHRKVTHKMAFTAEVGCSRCGQVFHSKKDRQGHLDARYLSN